MSGFDYIVVEKEEFGKILLSTGRDGITDLLRYLESTDFFTAPSSTKYHDTEPGGLLHHSLNVYGNLIRLNSIFQGSYPEDTLKIVGLLHDICKANFYKRDFKNVKVEGIWTQQHYISIEDQLPLGHGEKSVILLQRFIKLTDDEIMTIRWHMMAFDDLHCTYAGNLAITAASTKHPLIVLMHIADLSASFLKIRGEV